jgi:hypothetical protein
MTTTTKQYSPKFKARGDRGNSGREDAEPVGLAVQGASHPDREMAKGGAGATAGIVRGWTYTHARSGEAESNALYEEIGRLKVELDWLKKKLVCSTEDRRPLLEEGHPEISVRGNAICWASIARACITSRRARAKRTCN